MSNNHLQPSFSSGEIRPELHARVDLARYKTGVARARNFVVDLGGGLFTRPGLQFVEQTARQTDKVRLVEFKISAQPDQAYMLEFGHEYVRIFFNGGLVVYLSRGILNVDSDGIAPAEVRVDDPTTDLAVGVDVYLRGGTLPTGLRRQVLTIASVTPAAGTTVILTFEDPDGDPVIVPAIALGAGGNLDVVLVVATPYDRDDVDTLNFNQSGDIMTITSRLYPIYELARIAEDDWTMTEVTFAASIDAPINLAITPSAAGTTHWSYKVTAVSEDTGDESQASAREEINAAVDMTTTSGTMELDWDAVTGAQYYNVYRATPGHSTPIPANVQHGFVGLARDNEFIDSNIVPDFTRTPPQHREPFEVNNYPAVSCYFEQRLLFGGTKTKPQTLWGTRPGSFKNLDISDPGAPDDAYSFTLASTQINYIKHFVPGAGGLGIFTGGGFWIFSGPNGAVATPQNAGAKQHTYQGISDVKPLAIKFDILYVQSRGNIVSSLTSSNAQGSTNIIGQDLSTLSNHLFEGRRVRAWAYAEYPYSVIWAVMDDGILLAFTYLKEQEVFGWTQCESQGFFKDVCVVTEEDRDVVYFVIERQVAGKTRRLIERFADRKPVLTEDAFCVDCGLTTELDYPAGTLRALSANGNNVSFFSSDNVFTLGDEGRILRIGGGRATIVDYINAGEVQADITEPILLTEPGTDEPVVADEGEWSLTNTFNSVGGLDHLEGETVQILADGNVLVEQEVVDGSVALGAQYSLAHVGLGFICDIQTLPLDLTDQVSQGKRMSNMALTLKVYTSRGLQIGVRLNAMRDFKEWEYTDKVQKLFSRNIRALLGPQMDTDGQFWIRQDKPLPAMVLSVTPEWVLGN